MGRPPKFKRQFIDDMLDYFSNPPTETIFVNGVEIERQKYPTLAGFAIQINVCRDTLHEWAHGRTEKGRLKHPDFSDVYKKAKAYQEDRLVNGGLYGDFQPAFTIFCAKNLLKWKDKHEVELDTGGAVDTQGIADNMTAKEASTVYAQLMKSVEDE